MGDLTPNKLQAHEILCGHAVCRPDNLGTKSIFMKAERKGAEYVHHYLIQISIVKLINLALIYIDPEEILIDKGYIPTFKLASTNAHKEPDIGHIFKNNNGTFLKVTEAPKSQKMFAFIDINSGEVKRRQERNITKVYDSWKIINIT